MPYRATDREGRCYYCKATTDRACAACGHFVCRRCEPRHDAESQHREYAG